MYTILKKEALNEHVVRLVLSAPLIAKKAKPGQFIILRTSEAGERIPLTISDYSAEAGTISIVVQVVGASTMLLSALKEGESVLDVVGPLGKPSDIEALGSVCVVGGGVGCAIAYPIAKALKHQGSHVDVVVGFRSKELVIFKDELSAVSDGFSLMTDDGSAGQKGLVTQALDALLSASQHYDAVFAIGPLMMMKFVAKTAEKYGVKTIVSMNPIMIDGTGMCGGCRLTVGGKTRFACIDGPDFDASQVDFDEVIARGNMYRAQERHAYEKTCNLFKGGNV